MNLSVDKAQVNVDGEDIRGIENNSEGTSSEENIPAESSIQEVPESVKACFCFSSPYVRDQVKAIVGGFYLDSSSNLALIEAVLYDHNQLRKRNSHTSFVRALVDWGILPHDLNVEKTANGMSTKFKSLPSEGYKRWDNSLLNERDYCTKIGAKLDSTLKYSR